MKTPSDSAAASLLIGIAGGSAGGKTTLAKELIAAAGKNVAILELDRFYHPLGSTENCDHANFDEPAALDFKLLQRVLETLHTRGTASLPIYDFATHSRIGYETVETAPIIIVEGILVLWDSTIRDLLDFRLYVDAPAELRFQRRMKRDMQDRGRSAASIEQQWHETVRPMHDKYVEPSRQHADQIIDGNANLKSIANELLEVWLDALKAKSSDSRQSQID